MGKAGVAGRTPAPVKATWALHCHSSLPNGLLFPAQTLHLLCPVGSHRDPEGHGVWPQLRLPLPLQSRPALCVVLGLFSVLTHVPAPCCPRAFAPAVPPVWSPPSSLPARSLHQSVSALRLSDSLTQHTLIPLSCLSSRPSSQSAVISNVHLFHLAISSLVCQFLESRSVPCSPLTPQPGTVSR